jgi:hypothetical protein
VSSIDDALPRYERLFGWRAEREPFLFSSQAVRLCFLPTGPGAEARIELVEPVDGESGVARFLAARGEGVHHVCLVSDDLPADLAALAAAEAELRGGVSPRVSPFPDLQDVAGLLQRAGFALPVADAEELPLAYRTPAALLGDLRDAGEANAVLARDGRVPPRVLLPMAMARLAVDAAAAGPEGLRPVLRLLTATGWAPHESQSRPARPGSATARLADALGVEERSAGEQAPWTGTSRRGEGGD